MVAADCTAGAAQSDGGKSELHRAGCRVTPGRRKATESGTENIPPPESGDRFGLVRVKWCGKSAPRGGRPSRQAKPHPEQGQIGAIGLLALPQVGRMRRLETTVPDE